LTLYFAMEQSRCAQAITVNALNVLLWHVLLGTRAMHVQVHAVAQPSVLRIENNRAMVPLLIMIVI
jgi:hypothetical protein